MVASAHTADFFAASRRRSVVTFSRATPQLSVSTSSMMTKVVAGSLFRTRVSKSVEPSINCNFCSGVTPSRVTRILTYGMVIAPDKVTHKVANKVANKTADTGQAVAWPVLIDYTFRCQVNKRPLQQ